MQELKCSAKWVLSLSAAAAARGAAEREHSCQPLLQDEALLSFFKYTIGFGIGRLVSYYRLW
jgi:hypothetical protein